MRLQQRLVLGIGLVVVFAFAVGGALRPLIRQVRQSDLRGAVTRQGVATIEILYRSGPTDQGDTPTTPWAVVRFQGRLYRTPRALDAPELREHGPCLITYRVGRSGRIYVDSVRPLDTPARG